MQQLFSVGAAAGFPSTRGCWIVARHVKVWKQTAWCRTGQNEMSALAGKWSIHLQSFQFQWLMTNWCHLIESYQPCYVEWKCTFCFILNYSLQEFLRYVIMVVLHSWRIYCVCEAPPGPFRTKDISSSIIKLIESNLGKGQLLLIFTMIHTSHRLRAHAHTHRHSDSLGITLNL